MLRGSVIVCSHNRRASLQRCLEHVAVQLGAFDDVELVVVDNASTDGTAEMLRGWRGRVDQFRSAHEPSVGISRARNRALGIAAGEVLVFVDDDAIVADGWLRAMLEACEQGPAAAIAGRVELAWPGQPPRWLVPELERLFSGLDLGDEPRVLEAGEWPFAVNMSVRRDVALSLGGFDTRLGRVGRTLISNEEIDFCARLRRHGWTIGYEPRAVVTHVVPSERVSPSFVLRRAFAQGRSDARFHRKLSEGESGFDGRTGRALARATVLGWRGCARRLHASTNRRGQLLYEAVRRAAASGFAVELVREGRSRISG
jgi:glycosyltransferase involved in cell wall biosynthesis